MLCPLSKLRSYRTLLTLIPVVILSVETSQGQYLTQPWGVSSLSFLSGPEFAGTRPNSYSLAKKRQNGEHRPCCAIGGYLYREIRHNIPSDSPYQGQVMASLMWWLMFTSASGPPLPNKQYCGHVASYAPNSIHDSLRTLGHYTVHAV